MLNLSIMPSGVLPPPEPSPIPFPGAKALAQPEQRTPQPTPGPAIATPRAGAADPIASTQLVQIDRMPTGHLRMRLSAPDSLPKRPNAYSARWMRIEPAGHEHVKVIVEHRVVLDDKKDQNLEVTDALSTTQASESYLFPKKDLQNATIETAPHRSSSLWDRVFNDGMKEPTMRDEATGIEIAEGIENDLRITGRSNDNRIIDHGLGARDITGGPGYNYVEAGRGHNRIRCEGTNNVVYANGVSDIGIHSSTLESANYVDLGGDGNRSTVKLEGDGKNAVIGAGRRGSAVIDDRTQAATLVTSTPGHNTVSRLGEENLLIGKVSGSDKLPEEANGAYVVKLNDYEAPKELGLRIAAPKAQRTRLQRDMDALEALPIGRQAMNLFARQYQRYGNEVTISTLRPEIDQGVHQATNDPNIRIPGTNAEVRVNTSYSIHGRNPNSDMGTTLRNENALFIPPSIIMGHELNHWWNTSTGTANQANHVGGTDMMVKNVERQAVGLPYQGSAFDHDLDPSTPDTNRNPFPENDFLATLRYNPRRSYELDMG